MEFTLYWLLITLTASTILQAVDEVADPTSSTQFVNGTRKWPSLGAVGKYPATCRHRVHYQLSPMVDVLAAKVSGVNSYVNVLGVGRYKLHTEKLRYNDAVKVCENEDSHLAVPTSGVAEDVMVDLLRTTKLHLAFVGINDRKQEGKMETVTGKLYSEVAYTKWAWNEPDDFDNGEDCVCITPDKLLNDVPCHDYDAFFCEKNRLVPHDPY